MSTVGSRVLRTEDARFLQGEGTYVENLPLEGALHVTFVRSLLAHARINGVDTSAAEAMDGIQVFTGADVDVEFGPPPLPGLNTEMGRPLVAKDVVRFVGDIIAIVVSTDRASGADAAELVMVDYDPLPVVASRREAAKDETILFPAAGTNIAGHSGNPERDSALFDGCEVTVSGTFVSQRMAPCPLEPRSVAAVKGADGRITAWLCTQTPHQDRMGICGTLGLDPANLRIVSPDVGGGFGAKTLSVEEVLLVWLASSLGHPVRWTETRSESMVAMGHGRGMEIDFTIGGTRDGKVLAYRMDILADAGAYPVLGAFLPNLTALMASAVYAIPKIEAGGRSVVTNTTPITSFRGAGRPEATQTIERAMDMFAAELGLDAVEVRRVNLIPNDSFPHTTASGATYDSGDYERALDLVLDAAGYDELRAEQASRRELGVPLQLGIGVSTYIEISNPIAETEFGEVEITASGDAIVRTGSFSTARATRRPSRRSPPTARAAAREDQRPQGRHGRDRKGHRHLRLEVDPARWERRPRRGRPRRRAGAGARGRVHGRRGRRARRGDLGRARVAGRRRRPAGRAEAPSSSSCRRRASRSGRTWRSSRSTSRPAAWSCCGSSPSTTPAR